ncbi:MAG: hypothetical protein R3248_02810 [Candidatus Promineifilaceae bacterium]|nr:hypothetical protein [Candidatus Promineifilaceae bacterium]
MKEVELANLLAAQAEALVSGTNEKQWLADYHSHQLEAAGPLMEVARLLKRVLIPVPTPAPFRSQLRQDLFSGAYSSGAKGSVNISTRGRPRMWLGAAAVGSILSLAGLLFFWRRRGYPFPAGDRLKFSL